MVRCELSHFAAGKIYKEHDEDNNGTLNYHEALEAVKALGPFAKNYDDFRSEFSKVAKNGGLTFDGRLSYDSLTIVRPIRQVYA